MTLTYVSFDPGQSTGITEWDEKGNVIKVGIELKGDKALDIYLDSLEGSSVKIFIIEEYRVYGSNLGANIGSKVHTAQVIGYLKAWARRHKIKVIEQRADILKVAAKWAQVTLPKGHPPDWLSAYLHGYYYLHRQGLIKPLVLEAFNEQRDNESGT